MFGKRCLLSLCCSVFKPPKLRPSHDQDQSLPRQRQEQDFEGLRPSQGQNQGRQRLNLYRWRISHARSTVTIRSSKDRFPEQKWRATILQVQNVSSNYSMAGYPRSYVLEINLEYHRTSLTSIMLYHLRVLLHRSFGKYPESPSTVPLES